ncbi:hypothetical protein BGW80DRAFT_463433 [Lactifluus volemus]|nr:hypothetical protein BGW80DRAFT_463433 [Lactifluus volemus]
MKFASLVAFASLVCGALGQSIDIGYPHPGSQIKPGEPFTVQVVRPDTLTGSQEVAIVISLLNCLTHLCPSPIDILGNTLYSGPYNPQFPTTPTPLNAPQQNFTLTVPRTFKRDTKAQLTVTHLALVGAGPFALFEHENVTLHVQ